MSTSAQKSSDETVQCVICMEYEPYLSCKVYILPCSHVICRGCLLNIAAVSVEDHPCETCRSVTPQTVDTFPTASDSSAQSKEETILCHVCEAKEERNTADMYCYVCDNVYCDTHAGSHFDIHPGHKVVEIAEYRTSIMKLEKRFCFTHNDQELAFGCPGCNKTFCTACLPENTQCSAGGSAHKFTVLEKLEISLIQNLDTMRVEAQQKECEVNKLVKDTTIRLENWDKRTEELVSLLHQSRDDHIKAVKTEFIKIEQEFLKHRDEGRKEIEEFLEKQAEDKHNEIVRKLLIDFVENYKENMEFLKAVVSEVLPPLKNVKNDVISLKAEVSDVVINVELSTESGKTLSMKKPEYNIRPKAPAPKSARPRRQQRQQECKNK